MFISVARLDLGQTKLNVDRQAIGRCGHVAVRQCVGQKPVRRFELVRELTDQATFSSFVDRTGMMRDEATQALVGALDGAQVAGAIEGVESGDHEVGGVTDVVSPSGGSEEI